MSGGRLTALLSGHGLAARALRGSALTMISFGGMQAIRGVALFAACALLAPIVAQFYAVPELAWYLPVAGFVAVVAGVMPTRIETANRHLQLGRLTAMELASAFFGTAITVLLAAAIGSAWALVIGLVIGALVKLTLAMWMLPGHRNRLHWDRSAAAELFHFGKWIFPSTIVGFAISQGDKAILGKYLTLDQLGIYNIAFFLASFPVMLGFAVTSRVMIPIYRTTREEAASDGRAMRRLRRMRAGLTTAFLGLLLLMAANGPWLVGVMYDPRYAEAGPLVRMIACATIPTIIGISYDQSALAAGDTRGFFLLSLLRAVLFITLFLAGVHFAGLPGGLAGQALASVLTYPALARLAQRHQVWDPVHDAPCLACIFPDEPAPGLAPSCAEAGVVGALPGVIGSLMALEAIKLITGAGSVARGRLLILDGLWGETRSIAIRRNPDCPVCGSRG